ncbi:MAG: hypothetical protein QOG83_207 [Alphaproteobacteria bacterium]|jgi:hypothetical protein|nr:hypothetical protein [Alphaproteobacteria bacterium]
MIETGIARPPGAVSTRAFGPAVLLLAATLTSAAAQQPPPPAPGMSSRNPACVRLEGQLAALDRGNYDPARAEQIRRLEDAAARQQSELDRMSAQARRSGCEGRGFFSLFSGEPPQCSQINNQIAQTRANLDRVLADLQQTQGNSADREGQRRGILVALGQSDCGPQYRQFANRGGGGFFENLFGGSGPGSIITPAPDAPSGNTYRTVCVRTCDGFFFPISYSTVPGKFADDEKVCQAMCPASEAVLYSHRNPGEDIAQAVPANGGGRNYSELPTAFAYRKAFNPACTCKASGQTWADALKNVEDQTVERGDIVVNEERARQLSQPQVDAQGKPIRPPARPNTPAAKGAPPASTAAAPPEPETEPGKRQVRTVGPTFLPGR